MKIKYSERRPCFPLSFVRHSLLPGNERDQCHVELIVTSGNYLHHAKTTRPNARTNDTFKVYYYYYHGTRVESFLECEPY